MLGLTLKEQREILGGRWKAIVYDNPNEGKMIKYFQSEDEAISWATENSVAYWKVVEVA